MSPHSLLSVLVTHNPIGCLTKATTSFSWTTLMLTLIQPLFSCWGLCKIKYTKTKDEKRDWCQPHNGGTGNRVCLHFVSVSLSNLDQCSLASQMEPFLTPSLAKLFYNLPLYSAVFKLLPKSQGSRTMLLTNTICLSKTPHYPHFQFFIFYPESKSYAINYSRNSTDLQIISVYSHLQKRWVSAYC